MLGSEGAPAQQCAGATRRGLHAGPQPESGRAHAPEALARLGELSPGELGAPRVRTEGLEMNDPLRPEPVDRFAGTINRRHPDRRRMDAVQAPDHLEMLERLAR